jgi:hypothetical protein
MHIRHMRIAQIQPAPLPGVRVDFPRRFSGRR